MQINRNPYSDDFMCHFISPFWYWFDIGWSEFKIGFHGNQLWRANIVDMIQSIFINVWYPIPLRNKIKFSFSESGIAAVQCELLDISSTFRKKGCQIRLSRFDNRGDLMEFSAIFSFVCVMEVRAIVYIGNAVCSRFLRSFSRISIYFFSPLCLSNVYAIDINNGNSSSRIGWKCN